MRRVGNLGKISVTLFLVIAGFHALIGVYHTFLFTTQGSQSMFSIAYGIPVSSADMQDRARALGADAIEVYSILLFGVGVISAWASWLTLRGLQLGFWLNVVAVGCAELAISYGLIAPGKLSGVNGYASPVLYALAVLSGIISLWLDKPAPVQS